MKLVPVIVAVLLAASGASAQESSKPQALPSISVQGSNAKTSNAAKSGNTAQTGTTSTMADLVSRGYEIKAAVPNGGKFVVFMQKDQSAYACEFSSLTDTRCGSLN
ncbi:MAG: hypothetical protein KGI75_10805 [Rhizobiaceae bacterium]|nr:hypothetical protein [Rhizobiaceae bacterium]